MGRARLTSARVVLVVALVGGCNATPATSPGTPAQATSASSETASQAAPSEAAPITINWWHGAYPVNVPGFEEETKNPGDWQKLIAARFVEAHPNVTVKTVVLQGPSDQTKLPTAIQAGTPPDIMEGALTALSQYAFVPGLIEDISTLVPEDHLSHLLPAYREADVANNTMFMLPWYASPAGFVKYNRATFDSVEVAPPKDGVWTFDEFDSVLAKLAIPNKRWPLVARMTDGTGDYDWLGYLFGFGCRPFSKDRTKSTMNTPECIRGMNWLLDANSKGYVLPGSVTISFDDVDNAYFQGSTVISYGRADVNFRDTAPKSEGRVTVPLQSEIALYPNAEGVEPPGMTIFDIGYQVYKQSDPAKRQAIADLLVFATQPEYLDGAAVAFPSLRIWDTQRDPLRTSDDPDAANWQKVDEWISKYGLLDQGFAIPNYGQIRDRRAVIIQGIFLGQTTVEDGFKQIDEMADALITASP